MTDAWANFGKHKHRPTVEDGRRVCMDCHQVLIDPILTADDPRIPEVKPLPWQEDGFNPPLPYVLVEMYERNLMPAAPYIEVVSACEHPSNINEWLWVFYDLGQGKKVGADD